MAKLFRKPRYGSGSWSLETNDHSTYITTDMWTHDEKWTHVDHAGHRHYWDHGFPTLELIVDTSHWCMGNEGVYCHDPHEAVDEHHYECLTCREVIEPGMCPPGRTIRVPGQIETTLKGVRSDGAHIEMFLTAKESDAFYATADQNAYVQRLLDDAPDERVYSVTYHYP